MFRILHKENFKHFKMSLLAYDDIFVPAYHLEKFLSKDIQTVCDSNKPSLPNMDLLNVIDANTFLLFWHCLDLDLNVTKKLIDSKHLKNIYVDLSRQYHDKYLKEVFMEIPSYSNSNCPSAELFKEVLDYFIEYFPQTINNRSIELLTILLIDIMIGDHIHRQYGITPIYSFQHLLLKDLLASIKPISFNTNNVLSSDKLTYLSSINFSCEKIRKYYKSTDELFIIDNHEWKKQQRYDLLFQETVPDLSAVPSGIIYEAKQKDVFLSLPRLADKLSESKDISDEDLIKYFDEQVWKFSANSLKGSVPEVTLDVLSWATMAVPPLSLGVQFVTQSRGIADYWSSQYNSGWIIPLSIVKNYKP